MKGCPLSCRWCHNPEGISPLPETVMMTRKVGEKEFIREEEVGKYYTVDDIIKILDQEKVFISHSKGGVTFSGGEPMVQSEFLLEALKSCNDRGYSTAVDTSGYSSAENYRNIIPYTDLFLFDIKHLDDLKHIGSTGVSNTGILENFRLLLESGKDIMIRIPVIPGFNDDMVHMEELKNFILASGIRSVNKINLLPYHKIGSSKYKRFKMPYMMEGVEPPSSEAMQQLKQLFMETGIKVKIGG